MFERPRHQIVAHIHGNLEAFSSVGNTRKRTVLSIEDRFVRALMFWRGCKMQVLESMFGQKKTTIYDDAWLIIRVLRKAHASTLKFLLKNTRKDQDQDHFVSLPILKSFSMKHANCYDKLGLQIYFLLIIRIVILQIPSNDRQMVYLLNNKLDIDHLYQLLFLQIN